MKVINLLLISVMIVTGCAKHNQEANKLIEDKKNESSQLPLTFEERRKLPDSVEMTNFNGGQALGKKIISMSPQSNFLGTCNGNAKGMNIKVKSSKGSSIDKVPCNDNGEFYFTKSLADGEYEVEMIAADSNGEDLSSSSAIKKIILVDTSRLRYWKKTFNVAEQKPTKKRRQ